MVTLKSLVTWAAILLLAFINGGVREGILFKYLSRPSAFILSGILLIACVVAVSIWLMPWVGVRTLKQCAVVGATWLALTLIFEFGVGFAQGKGLSVILDAYSFREGNIWPLVLVVVAAAPSIGACVRGVLASHDVP